MQQWATLIIITPNSSDEVPIGRDTDTGKVHLLDAPYDLANGLDSTEYENTVNKIVEHISKVGHLLGEYVTVSEGVEITTV